MSDGRCGAGRGAQQRGELPGGTSGRACALATHTGRGLLGGDIGVMSRDRENPKRQHHKRDVTVPAVPGTGLIVIETDFVFAGLEGVLDRPAVSLDPDQDFNRGARGTPGVEICKVPVGKVTPDQQISSFQDAARPCFVNGCFWHGHKPCKVGGTPKTRTEFWTSGSRPSRSVESKTQIVQCSGGLSRAAVAAACQRERASLSSLRRPWLARNGGCSRRW